MRGKRWRWRGRGEELKVKLPLPPGPPLAGNWFVGSLSVFRTEYVWQTFAEWSKSLGMSLVMHNKVISITPTSGGYFDHEDCFFFFVSTQGQLTY